MKMNLKKLVSFFLVFVLIGAYTFSYLSLKVYAIDNEYEQSVEKKTDNNESGIWEQAMELSRNVQSKKTQNLK